MNFYVVNGKSPKALAVIDCVSIDLAEERARKRFGCKAIVIDEELYQLEQSITTKRGIILLKRLMRKHHRMAQKGA
jgi:hypothetical protein